MDENQELTWPPRDPEAINRMEQKMMLMMMKNLSPKFQNQQRKDEVELQTQGDTEGSNDFTYDIHITRYNNLCRMLKIVVNISK
ncbi:uncharacterized protein LOC130799156 isoform X2 [Amaranthus tricolor]|uniref:uncharacterized protein LOC130799156 isoform X2 n=1 Tax=Amaranthus tricolor TaxID=29722 RepID=UPI0025842485|nr:uncharacterized protein LOC130799156 isoform X2 [Amaranthus tricolor]